jgi:hypothetical protein
VVWVRIILVSVHFAVVGALKRRDTGISRRHAIDMAMTLADAGIGLGRF